jgi:signal transduction histidine kinase
MARSNVILYVSEFNIYLLSSLEPQKYGEVVGSVCDDFDYKLIASADEKQNVHIKIIRNEYDLDLIPKDFFNRSNMKKEKKYTEESFRKSYWETTMTFSQLLPGFKTIDYDKVFNNIGVFEFSFYYLKRTYATKDAERFFYRLFNSNDRKIWLDKFGGIKLFRDNFRVRPYGEKQDVAFDWLNLGSRKAKSPAGISKSDGGYRVEPDNVAGAIKISRLTNVNFEDKSSREGLQDNKTFQIFKSLISNIISIFELDRSYIAKEMDAFYDEQYGPIIAKKEAEDIAKKILEEHRKKLSEQKVFNNKEFEDEKDRNLTIIAHLNEQKDEEIEKLKEEQILLRGLASCGLALASFSHDLSKITDVLEYRFDKFRNLISDKLSEANYIGVEDRKNPFRVLERMKKDDIKMKTWLNFSLGFTRKDKRNRKQVFLKKYFDKLKSDWETVFQSRGINIDLSNIADITMRIFEIDLDSIFTNLFVNSIDAFNSLKENRTREIKILINATLKGINIDYYDNGTGLSKDISAPEIIFKPMFTTKKNQYTGEDEGTGLGMWIVKSIVEENDGQIKLLFPKIGFSIRMIFPIKYGRQGNV